MIVSGRGKECLLKSDIIWCQLFKIDLWLRIINFSTPLPDHGPIQAILSHDTAPAPRFARLSLLCSSILKPHLRNIRIFFAHLSRPWSIGWVALSFLVRLFVVVVPLWWHPTKSPLFSIYTGIKAPYQHSTTWFQAAPSYTDPVPPITNLYRSILTQY